MNHLKTPFRPAMGGHDNYNGFPVGECLLKILVNSNIFYSPDINIFFPMFFLGSRNIIFPGMKQLLGSLINLFFFFITGRRIGNVWVIFVIGNTKFQFKCP